MSIVPQHLRTGPDPEEISAAVRELRAAFDQTQKEFGETLGATIRTVTRYETDRPPRGNALIRLWELAQAKKLDAVADVLRRAFVRDLWVAVDNSGFIDEFYKHLEKEVTQKFESTIRQKLCDEISADFASRGIAVDLSGDEQAFLTAALQAFRNSDPDQRRMLSDIGRLIERANWMRELEEKFRRANAEERVSGPKDVQTSPRF
ncbi:MAG TPA: hypothetical protein VN442_15450 [Bryobacteraceae bacterium]|nr:hypothetical protein [Bryobacteraceae bacterium]